MVLAMMSQLQNRMLFNKPDEIARVISETPASDAVRRKQLSRLFRVVCLSQKKVWNGRMRQTGYRRREPEHKHLLHQSGRWSNYRSLFRQRLGDNVKQLGGRERIRIGKRYRLP